MRRFAAESRLPVVVWLVVTAIVLGAATYARHDPFSSAIWSHSDSKLYLAQVENGTHLYRCPSAPTTEWCGDAGWFPAYPWLISLVHIFGVPARGAAVVLAWLFGAATLVLLWWTFLERRPSSTSILALLYAAVAPGIAFRYGVYPLSMLGFFAVACLWQLTRGRLVLAGLAGAAAVCSYPAGLALLPAAGIWLLSPRAGLPARRRLEEAAVACGLAVLGLVAVLGWEWAEVGRPDAYFLVQDKYNHTLRDPFAPIHNAVSALNEGRVFALSNVPHLELLVLSLTLGVVVVSVLVKGTAAGRDESLIVLWAVAAWLLTSVPAYLSHYREDAVLLPIAPLVGRLPRPLAAVIVIVSACLTVPMTILYVRGKLP